MPRIWDNSTFKFDAGIQTGWDMYWISCRDSGPDFQFTTGVSECDRQKDSSTSQVHFHSQPSNDSDAAQYWFFLEFDTVNIYDKYDLLKGRANSMGGLSVRVRVSYGTVNCSTQKSDQLESIKSATEK